MATVVAVVAVAALVLLTALLSAASASVVLVGRGRARRLLEAERKGAVDLERMFERPGRLLAARALAAGVAYAASSALLTWTFGVTYADIPLWGAGALGLGVSIVVIFVFGEALPRTVGLQNPEGVALATAPLARPTVAVLYPLARGLSVVWTWGFSLASGRHVPGAPWVTEEEHEHYGDGEAEEDDHGEEALIEAVGQFAQRIVREVMVPRTDMRSLEDSTTAREALEVIEEAGYSRLPIYHDSLDDIRGVLYAKDLLLSLGREFDLDMRVAKLARAAYFVPETKPVEELLVEMRRTSHIAIVADEYGGTAGLVTIEDLLEEIVGDIFDEYDRQVPVLVDLGRGRFRVDARMPVADLNEAFATAIEREADSVGGLFIEEAGHIPAVGESVEVEGLRLEVIDLEGNRIRQLVVETAARIEEGHDGGTHAG